MDIDALTDDDRKQLAKDLAAELDTGLYGNRAVLSRRQLLSLAGGSAGVAGLVALGVDPATAQSAAGQVGTEASPADIYAFNLDVQGALQRDLDAGGQAITNAGSVSSGEATIGSGDTIKGFETGTVTHSHSGSSNNDFSDWDFISTDVSFNTDFDTTPTVWAEQVSFERGVMANAVPQDAFGLKVQSAMFENRNIDDVDIRWFALDIE